MNSFGGAGCAQKYIITEIISILCTPNVPNKRLSCASQATLLFYQAQIIQEYVVCKPVLLVLVLLLFPNALLVLPKRPPVLFVLLLLPVT